MQRRGKTEKEKGASYLIQITCLFFFLRFSFCKGAVFGLWRRRGTEKESEQIFRERSYLVCWYDEKKKKKEEGKERLCSHRKSDTEKERGENLFEK